MYKHFTDNLVFWTDIVADIDARSNILRPLVYLATGNCKFGMDCNFAHGEPELRQQATGFHPGKVIIHCSVADPGCLSRILIFTHPGSRIPDPKTGTKERSEKKFDVIPFL